MTNIPSISSNDFQYSSDISNMRPYWMSSSIIYSNLYTYLSSWLGYSDSLHASVIDSSANSSLLTSNHSWFFFSKAK